MCRETTCPTPVVHARTRWYISEMQEEPLPGRPKPPSAGEPAAAAAQAAEDAALVAAVTRGDKSALAGLYDRHCGLLLALGIRILGDRTLAEDVLHDCFLEAWHHAADFDPARGTVRAWLVTRMRSRSLDRRATVIRQKRLAEEVKREGGGEEGAAAVGGPALDSERVRMQIAGLSPDLALVIELGYFDGLSSSEIATHLGIPIGTVKSRTARALGLLRQGLADLHDADQAGGD
jgi:RNA polymerase sigma-70 factor, ECF subfamily